MHGCLVLWDCWIIVDHAIEFEIKLYGYAARHTGTAHATDCSPDAASCAMKFWRDETGVMMRIPPGLAPPLCGPRKSGCVPPSIGVFCTYVGPTTDGCAPACEPLIAPPAPYEAPHESATGRIGAPPAPWPPGPEMVEAPCALWSHGKSVCGC